MRTGDGLGAESTDADLVEWFLDRAVQGLAGEAGEVDRHVVGLERALDVGAESDWAFLGVAPHRFRQLSLEAVLGGHEVRRDEQDHDVGGCQLALDVPFPVRSRGYRPVAPDVDQAGPYERRQVHVQPLPVALVDPRIGDEHPAAPSRAIRGVAVNPRTISFPITAN
jgi:hypothetical protein